MEILFFQASLLVDDEDVFYKEKKGEWFCMDFCWISIEASKQIRERWFVGMKIGICIIYIYIYISSSFSPSPHTKRSKRAEIVWKSNRNPRATRRHFGFWGKIQKGWQTDGGFFYAFFFFLCGQTHRERERCG